MGAQETPRQELEISELDQMIIQQIEYYFGNYNLARDKFLKEQIKLDDGWIPLETMLKFNRLKRLSEDPAVIVSALKKSQSQLLEVSEDETKIRRCVDKPIPEFSSETKSEVTKRTIYAKRFPLTATLDELLQFFKRFGNVENVFMKKKPNKKFKGSVFVTFNSQEEAESFVKLEEVKFNNTDLIRESKEAYGRRKEQEFQLRKLAKENKQKKNEPEEKKEEPEDFEKKITRGCVMKLSNLSETTRREDLLEVFKSDGDIAYLDYSRGKPVAYIRFSQAIAESVLAKKSKDDDDCKKITVNDVDAVAVVLEGDAETEYWQKLYKGKSEKRIQMSHFKKGKGRFNPKTAGRNRFGKRRHEQEGEEKSEDGSAEPPLKNVKVDKSDHDSD